MADHLPGRPEDSLPLRLEEALVVIDPGRAGSARPRRARTRHRAGALAGVAWKPPGGGPLGRPGVGVWPHPTTCCRGARCKPETPSMPDTARGGLPADPVCHVTLDVNGHPHTVTSTRAPPCWTCCASILALPAPRSAAIMGPAAPAPSISTGDDSLHVSCWPWPLPAATLSRSRAWPRPTARRTRCRRRSPRMTPCSAAIARRARSCPRCRASRKAMQAPTTISASTCRGNLCRCAAYPNIVAAIRDVAQQKAA